MRNLPSFVGLLLALTVGVMFSLNSELQAQIDCSSCHPAITNSWPASRHANTQIDIAGELAANWSGQPPDSVIHGSQAENCVACHAPTAVATSGGMTETGVMGYFFTTLNGLYSPVTSPAHASSWPHVFCDACHQMPSGHPEEDSPTLALFSSTSARYQQVANPSVLCGQCHGSLRFAETDHRVYDGWKASNHGHRGQSDVAGELAASRVGSSPDEVINGSEAEDCIACHAPTATKVNGGISDAEALGRFFTTSGGVITSATSVADTLEWPDVACNACHDPHNPGTFSYFNSKSRMYEVETSSNELCGQCHGSLRFPNTDHLSYNIEEGTGGIGVADQVMMPGVQCVDCHMHRSDVEGSHSSTYEGHRWSVFVPEESGGESVPCTRCHPSRTADSARAIVEGWKAAYQLLLETAQERVARADSLTQGTTDSLRIRYLDEAKQNLGFAGSDEAAGAHNFNYLVALLNDAIAKADIALSVEEFSAPIPEHFELSQNYPNPFNPVTQIEFSVPRSSYVKLDVFNALGQKIRGLVSERLAAGRKRVTWDGADDAGKPVASGVYLYRLTAGDFADTKKMLILK